MITKLATFSGVTSDGEPLNRVFRPGDSIQKVAGRMMPEVQDWLSTYKSDKENVAVLVSALGATEYWGQNSNGDAFRWGPLSHDCRKHDDNNHAVDEFTGKVIPPYGYWTFLMAHAFAHHKNKDPLRAFGDVKVAVLNKMMRRVELVVLLNRARALEFGGSDAVDRIDAGEFPDVSMGCRVPYDVCLICGNKSKTRNDYCDCIKKFGMGTILPDGRRVGVDNPHPRFFDISLVFIGADKGSKVMVKLGSGLYVPISVVEAELLYGVTNLEDSLVKSASACGLRCDTCKNKVCEKHQMMKVASDKWNANYQAGLGVAEQFHTNMKGMDSNTRRRYKRRVLKELNALPKVEGSPDYASYTLPKTAESRVGPPPSPNRKEYPFVGTIQYKGLTIHVENKRGDVREGVGPGGKKWRTHMLHHYGEIHGTQGTDRDKLDVYVGPESDAKEVYVVHQNFPGNHPTKAGKYDEDKVMLGFSSPDAAKEAYLKHYDRKDFFRSMTTIPFSKFKEMIMGEVKGEKVASIGAALTAGAIGAGLGGAAGAAASPEGQRLRGALRGAGIGAVALPAAGAGIGAAANKILKMRGARIVGKDVSSAERAYVKAVESLEALKQDRRVVRDALDRGPADIKTYFDTMKPLDEAVWDAGRAVRDAQHGVEFAKTQARNPLGAVLVHGNQPLNRALINAPMAAAAAPVAAGVAAAPTEKTAEASLSLEDLFDTAKFAERRQRRWTDKETGKSVCLTGSGLKTKTAAFLSKKAVLKLSAEKAAEQRKWAEIIKRIDPEANIGRVAALLSEREADLPEEVLEKMEEPGGLVTPSAMGIVLKPREFQRITLCRMGHRGVADDLDERGVVFGPTDRSMPAGEDLSLSSISPHLMRMLMPHMAERSYFGPILRRRIITIRIKPRVDEGKEKEASSDLLDVISACYNWYRDQMLKTAAESAQDMSRFPALQAAVYGIEDGDLFKEGAAIGGKAGTIAAVGSLPATMMYSAHQRKRMGRGEYVGAPDRFIAKHPLLSSLGTAAGLKLLLKADAALVGKGKPPA